MEPSSTTTEISLSVILEAILLAANEPLSLRALREAVGGRYDTMAIQDALDKLTDHWQSRGLELISIASGYRFRTKPALQVYIERTQINRAPRYSKSVMETLAIIAYRQPVTRGGH
jgi:segregation and condensation protein B